MGCLLGRGGFCFPLAAADGTGMRVNIKKMDRPRDEMG